MEKTEPGVPYKDIEDNDDTKKLVSVLLEIKVAQQKIKKSLMLSRRSYPKGCKRKQ